MQVQLEEAEHKLDAIDTVKAALERQVKLMLTYAHVAAPAYVSIAAGAAHATREEELFLGPILYVSSFCYTCVLILLYIQVELMQREEQLLRMYVSSQYYICVLILLYIDTYRWS